MIGIRGIARELASARREWLAEPPLHRAAAVAMMAFATAIGIAHLDQPMRYDEAWMYLNFASRSLGTVVGDYSLPNNHVFHTLLVWVTTRVFGNAPWAIRLPTVIAAILLVPATYLATRRVAGAAGALIASALVAGAPVLVLYATNARGYLLICLATMVLIDLAAALLSDDTVDLWIAFALVAALGAFTTPVMLYPAGCVGLWLLFEAFRSGGAARARHMATRMAGMALGAGALTAIAYGVVILRSGITPLVANKYVAPLPWSQFFGSLWGFSHSLRELLGLGVGSALVWVLVAAAVWSLVPADANRGRRVTLALASVIGASLVLVGTRREPAPRIWLFAVPMLCLFSGAGLALVIRTACRAIPSRERVASVAAAFALVAWFGVQLTVHRVVRDSEETDFSGLREAPEIARYLLPQLRAGDRVIAQRSTGVALDYYLLALGQRRLAEFDSASSGTGRVFVIVNERHGQTLDLVRERRPDVRWPAMDELVPARTFDRTRVYATAAGTGSR